MANLKVKTHEFIGCKNNCNYPEVACDDCIIETKWFLYHNISRHVYSETTYDAMKNAIENGSFKLITFNPKEKIPSDPLLRIGTIRETAFGEQEDIFLIDTEAYILNDQGDTIEILMP